jgi:hypothetical protein
MGKLPCLALALVLAGCAHTDPGSGDEPDGRRYDARPPGDGSETADAMLPKPDAAPTPDGQPIPDGALPVADAPTMACGTTGPDLCTAAMDLTAGASSSGGVSVTAETTGLGDDIALEPLLCTGYLPDGPDTVYRVTAGASKTITVSVAPEGWDVSVYIMAACDDVFCLAGADTGLDGDPETISYTTVSAGTYLIVVDGWDPAAFGCYHLTVTIS